LRRLKRHMKYRSLLERNTFEQLDKMPSVVDIEGERIRIEYWWKGAKLNYVPDAIVKLKSGLVWILEVKPKSQIGTPRNKAKFLAAREFCRTRGEHLQFGIVTNPSLLPKFLKTHKGVVNC